MINITKKFTKSSLKKFIRENKENLYIKIESSFNGMIDCVEYLENTSFQKVDSNKIDFESKYDFGINGLRLVGGDLFRIKEQNQILVRNCCGSCILKVGA